MKISVVTLYDEGRKGYGDFTSAIAKQYCHSMGYTFIRHTALLNKNLHPSWNKLIAIQQHLKECDWLFWVDADALIVNQKIKLEEILASCDTSKDILFSSDLNGLCAGVFFIKNTPWSHEFIQRVLFLGEMSDASHLYEQKTIRALYDRYPDVQKHIGLIDETLIQNPRSPFSPSAFMMHFWGNQSSYEVVETTLNNIITHGWKEEFFWAPVKGKAQERKQISYLMACMNRIEHIKEGLSYSLKNLGPNAELVLLDYNSSDGLKEYILNNYQEDLTQKKLIYLRTEEPKYFLHSHSRNVLALAARGPILCVLDADNCLMEGFSTHLIESFNKHGAQSIGICETNLPCHGRMAIHRENWLKVRGFNEAMMGWGWEDNDFRVRALKIPLKAFTLDSNLMTKVIKHGSPERIQCLPPEFKSYSTTNEKNKQIHLAHMQRGVITVNEGKPWGVATLRDHEDRLIMTGQN